MPFSTPEAPGAARRGTPLLRRFANHGELAQTLATDVAARLRRGITARGTASLLVPGGSTPALFLETLARQVLDWSRLIIAPTDERMVVPADEASNERLLRTHLLRGDATAARLVGLWNDAADPATRAWQNLAALPRPFDAVVLGMGADGHFASLFPDDPASATALSTATPAGCVLTRAPVAPQQRMSLNLAALLQARALILLITGEPKWSLLQAQLADPATVLPVRTLLDQPQVPLTVYWSP